MRLLQIWIEPDEKNRKPNYGDFNYNWQERCNQWLQLVSGKDGRAKVKINQDASVHVLELDAGNKQHFSVAEGRQAYLVQVEGKSRVNNIDLSEGDSLESIGEDLEFTAVTTSHLLLIESFNT